MKNLRYLVVGLIGGLVMLSCCGQESAETSVKVISYNIRLSPANDGENSWEFRKGATLQLFTAEEPDLVGMQEVIADQFDFIQENTEDYGIVGVGRDDGVRRGEMMAVMYKKERFEKLAEGHFWLSESPDEVSRGWDGACNRMVTWLRLKDNVTGEELYFFNTHFDHMGVEARTESSKLIVEKIGDIAGDRPFVLTGDFNARADDVILTALRNSFPSARDTAPVTDSKDTFNGFGKLSSADGNSQGDLVIDHIYYGGFEALEFVTLDGDYGAPYISDHFPVAGVFRYAAN